MSDIYRFCTYCIDSWEEEDKLDKNVKRKRYSPSIEKFSFACELFNIKPEDKMEAMNYVQAAVEAANDAPEQFIKKQREERWKREKELRELK